MIITITVTGKDRPGIISALTGTIYKVGGNLEDASMTILEGEFAMIVLVDLKSKSTYPKIQSQLSQLSRRMGLRVSIEGIKYRLVRGEKHRSGTIPWIVSVLGKDRAGIVYQVSKALSDFGLNITDLNSKIIGKGRETSYALVLEVDIPRKNSPVTSLKNKFQMLQKKLGVTIAFHPIEASSF